MSVIWYRNPDFTHLRVAPAHLKFKIEFTTASGIMMQYAASAPKTEVAFKLTKVPPCTG